MRCTRHNVDMVEITADHTGRRYTRKAFFRCQVCVDATKASVRYARAHNWNNRTRRGLLQLNGEALWARDELWLSLKA